MAKTKNIRIPMSKETKEKISLSKKGKCNHSQEWIDLMSKKMKGRKYTEEHKKHIHEGKMGHEVSVETKLKISKSLTGKRCGKENNLWRGGVSKLYKTERQLLMTKEQYKNWRRLVFIRDNFTCQYCKEVGGILNAHHIKKWSTSPELRFDIRNGITLCEFCHRELHKILIITKKNVTTT